MAVNCLINYKPEVDSAFTDTSVRLNQIMVATLKFYNSMLMFKQEGN